MLPFDMDVCQTLPSPGDAPVVPHVTDFDPAMETLSFFSTAGDADAAIRLRDLPDQSGVCVEVGGKPRVVLMGVRACEIGPNTLQLESNE